MATYYVRKTGSDAAAGTSAGAAWATIGKALGASGATSGDTVYVGAGIYRESSTMTVFAAPTSTLNVIGDVDGKNTGDAGEVRLSGYWPSDFSDISGDALDANSKNFLAFSNLVFVACGNNFAVRNCKGHDISFTDCAFMAWSSIGTVDAPLATVDAPSNLTFERCIFFNRSTGGGSLGITIPRSSVADYDVGVTIQNCEFIGQGQVAILMTASGASGTFKGGGVKIRSCTITQSTAIQVSGANVSSTIPCTVYDCIVSAATGLTATTLGQIVEDYNAIFSGGARSNVAIGLHSTTTSIAPAVHVGQERIWGGQPKPFLSPCRDSPLVGFGSQAGGPSVDLANRVRPGGAGRVVASGTATAGAATTLTDSGASFGLNALNGAVVRITGGTGSGQAKMIRSHTGTVLTLFGNWQTNPDNTSTYVIYFGNPTDCGTATSATATTLVQSSASWASGQWVGFTVEITAGTGSGQSNTISGNSTTALTVPTWGVTPDNTSKFKIYRQTSETAVNKTVGALERHDTAEKETATTDVGGVAFRLTGYADQRILVPVDASSTTISIRARYDANHAATNKPQAVLLANGEIGVTTETKTMTAAANTWETLTFAAQTPTGKGWVTIELRARADVVIGEAFFDTLVVA